MKLFQKIGYALEHPSHYFQKYLFYHIRHLGKKFLRTYLSIIRAHIKSL